MTFAGPPYRTPDQDPAGPCYVLDPELWPWREVLAVLPPKLVKTRRLRRILAATPRVLTGETRRVVAWPRGRPLDWRLVDEPVTRPAPRWHTRARLLLEKGWSFRRIAVELGMSTMAVHKYCKSVQ